MRFRRFTSRDAESCFRIRSNAFIHEFYNEIGPKAVAACVNAYMPEDYVLMAREVEFFVVEEKDRTIGFFTIKRIDETRAELPLIYLEQDYQGKGIGTECMRYMEDWITSHWEEVDTFIVDTIIPNYNGDFYKKTGFEPIERVQCEFPDLKVSALRLQKKLGREGR